MQQLQIVEKNGSKTDGNLTDYLSHHVRCSKYSKKHNINMLKGPKRSFSSMAAISNPEISRCVYQTS